ncbi:MAG: hypothetical protein ACLVB5_14600 [Christensenellales bacterium]
MYPDLTPKQRENAFCREHGTAFIHGHRRLACAPASRTTAARRTTTTGTLNGDLLFWNHDPGQRAGDLLHGHPRRTRSPWTAS